MRRKFEGDKLLRYPQPREGEGEPESSIACSILRREESLVVLVRKGKKS